MFEKRTNYLSWRVYLINKTEYIIFRRERKEQQQARLFEESQIDNNNPISNPVDIPEAQYLPPDQDGEPATKIWTFLLDEEPYSIVFCKC